LLISFLKLVYCLIHFPCAIMLLIFFDRFCYIFDIYIFLILIILCASFLLFFIPLFINTYIYKWYLLLALAYFFFFFGVVSRWSQRQPITEIMNLRNHVLNCHLFSATIQNVLSIKNVLSFKIITLPSFELCCA
jgi:hypothetical protein